MKFSEWKALTADERKVIKWRHRPHIKAATLFGIAFLMFAFLFIARVGKNETAHLSVKPNATQAYKMAQNFVKDKLKLPASADFPKNSFESNIDTASNSYQLSGLVNAQDVAGHFQKQQWTANMKFIGGDWADRKSWQVEQVDVK
jgi:hypothetical protein